MTITDYRMKEFVFYTMKGYDFAKLHAEVKQIITTHEVQCIAELEKNWISYRHFGEGLR